MEINPKDESKPKGAKDAKSANNEEDLDDPEKL